MIWSMVMDAGVTEAGVLPGYGLCGWGECNTGAKALGAGPGAGDVPRDGVVGPLATGDCDGEGMKVFAVGFKPEGPELRGFSTTVLPLNEERELVAVEA